MNKHKEIEVRFLEMDKAALMARLAELGAEDRGEDLLEEVICYDRELTWRDGGTKILRVRKTNAGIMMAYKDRPEGDTIDGTVEIELAVSDFDTAVLFLEKIGYPAYRHQEKKRHTFVLDGVMVEIDTWPKIPTYVELEGESEQALRDAAEKLGMDWANVVTDNPRKIIEGRYHIPVGQMKWFTFAKFE